MSWVISQYVYLSGKVVSTYSVNKFYILLGTLLWCAVMSLLCRPLCGFSSALWAQYRLIGWDLAMELCSGLTLKNHMLLIANNTTVASQTNHGSPVYMASTSQTASSNWQAMTAQPKLQKLLHAPPRNLKLTIPSTWAIRLKLLLVCA